MQTFLWPAEDGWPYPDTGPEITDPDAVVDDELLSLQVPSPHLFDQLDAVERQVITTHYGLGGGPVRNMKQLHTDTGLSRAELRQVLGSGLDKLRTQLR